MSSPASPLVGPLRVCTSIVDLLRKPGGPRDRQLLFGDTVQVLETDNGWSHILADKDGYQGYVPSADLGPGTAATHWISAPSSHLYEAPDLKSPDRLPLSFGSRIVVRAHNKDFAETADGLVPNVHLTPIGTHLSDPLKAALLFLGTPYLWGGNSRFGIDCSGLVQAAFLACGRACPGDSGQQETAFGPALAANTPAQRGDLLFWNGHVALVVDPDTILHANAHRMAVTLEPLQIVLDRIVAQGEGPLTSHRRP